MEMTNPLLPAGPIQADNPFMLWMTLSRLPRAVQLLSCIASLAWVGHAFAQDASVPCASEEPPADESSAQFERRNLAGWEGIFLHCRISGDTGPATARICAQVAETAKSRAAEAGVHLEVIDSEHKAAVAAGVSPFLMLRVDLTATEGGPPVAMYAHLRAYSYYLGAVDRRAVRLSDQPNPREAERSGEMMFWERRLVGVCGGAAEPLATRFTQAIDSHVSAFIRSFATAQDQPELASPPKSPSF